MGTSEEKEPQNELAAAFIVKLGVDEYGDETTTDISREIYVDTLQNIQEAVKKSRELEPELHREGDQTWSVHYAAINMSLDAQALLRAVEEIRQEIADNG
jgi:hypothetical protein